MTGKRLEIPIKRILLGAKPADVVSSSAVDKPDLLDRLRGARPGVSVDAGESSAGGFPRIARMLPTRFSRDPKTKSTTENTAAGLLLAGHRRRDPVGEFAVVADAIGRCWTRTSGSASATCTSS